VLWFCNLIEVRGDPSVGVYNVFLTRIELVVDGDGCRLDAHNFPLARCMVGEGKENEKISPKNLF